MFSYIRDEENLSYYTKVKFNENDINTKSPTEHFLSEYWVDLSNKQMQPIWILNFKIIGPHRAINQLKNF